MSFIIGWHAATTGPIWLRVSVAAYRVFKMRNGLISHTIMPIIIIMAIS